MKLAMIALIMLLISCGKKDSSSTGPGNTAPVLSGIGNQTIQAGVTINITLSAADADGDPLTFSIPTNPGFLTITDFSQDGNTATAVLNIAPGGTISGTFDVTVQVNDGEGGSDSQNFTVTVTAPLYSMTDLAGTWSGNVQNARNNFSVTVTISNEGIASGTGAGGDFSFSDDEWTMSDTGEVAGTGVVSIHASGMLIIEWGHWSLQLSQDKTTLTGEFSCNSLGSMNVNLDKQ